MSAKNYRKEVKKKLNYFPTWLPNTPINIGDIGVFINGQFAVLSNLKNRNIHFEVEKDNSRGNIFYCSENAVNITPQIDANIPVNQKIIKTIEASAIINFTKNNAIYFNANNTLIHRIKDQIELENDIIKRLEKGKWQEYWAVVTEVVTAENAVIFISKSKESSVTVKGKVDIGFSNINLADINAGFEMTNSKGISTAIIAKEPITPLFNACKITKSIFSNPQLGQVRRRRNSINSRLDIGIDRTSISNFNDSVIDEISLKLPKENKKYSFGSIDFIDLDD